MKKPFNHDAEKISEALGTVTFNEIQLKLNVVIDKLNSIVEKNGRYKTSEAIEIIENSLSRRELAFILFNTLN